MPTKYVWWKEQQGISKPINKTCLSFCVVSVLIIKRLLSSASCFALGGCFSLEAEGAQRLLTWKFFFGKALDRWLSTSMANNTLNGTSAGLPVGLHIFLIALNIFLSITVTLGNALILVALRKISSIYPPTKLLFRCLAVTDLCVGLLCQPLDVFFILADFRHINYIKDIPSVIHNFFVDVFFAASALTSAAISVDRLLALLLGLRYRHVVTLCRVRVLIACVWFSAVSNASLFYVRGQEVIPF